MIIKSTTGYESYTISVIIISSYGTTRMQVSGVLQKGTNLMKFAAEIPKKSFLCTSSSQVITVENCSSDQMNEGSLLNVGAIHWISMTFPILFKLVN